MIPRRFLTLISLAALLAGCASHDASVCPECAATATVTPVAKTALNAGGAPIRFPQGDAEVSACTYLIPPGAQLPVHKHPYPRFAYVLEGDLRVTLDGGKTFDYHAGDFIAEVVDTWHSGETLGKAPVKLFVIDTTPPGVANVIKK